MGDIQNVPQPKDVIPSSMQCPMLNSTNYMVWSMRMKVMLRIHKVWETIDPGSTDSLKNDIAIGLLFQSISESLVLQVGEQESPKLIWDAIKAQNLGVDHVKEARIQTLQAEFERLKMRDMDTIDSFAGKLSELATKSASLGETIEEAKLVKKFLNCLPRNKYIQIVSSLEQVLDLKTTSFEDIIGRLKAYEERIHEENHGDTQNKLFSQILITIILWEREAEDAVGEAEETEEEEEKVGQTITTTHKRSKIIRKRRRNTRRLFVSSVKNEDISPLTVERRNKRIKK